MASDKVSAGQYVSPYSQAEAQASALVALQDKWESRFNSSEQGCDGSVGVKVRVKGVHFICITDQNNIGTEPVPLEVNCPLPPTLAASSDAERGDAPSPTVVRVTSPGVYNIKHQATFSFDVSGSDKIIPPTVIRTQLKIGGNMITGTETDQVLSLPIPFVGLHYKLPAKDNLGKWKVEGCTDAGPPGSGGGGSGSGSGDGPCGYVEISRVVVHEQYTEATVTISAEWAISVVKAGNRLVVELGADGKDGSTEPEIVLMAQVLKAQGKPNDDFFKDRWMEQSEVKVKCEKAQISVTPVGGE
jgi:hypothetical protein